METVSRTPTQTIRAERHEMRQGRFSTYLELFIVCSLSISIAVIFFNVPRWTRAFGEAGFGALLLWALYHERKPVNPIPKPLIVASVLYILSYVVNVFMCSDPDWEHVNIRKYIYIIISGLLFAFPVKDKYRIFMLIVFLTSAAIAGVVGIFQYISLGVGTRSEGFSGNPLHYAGQLGFVFCSACLLLFIKNRTKFRSSVGTLMLSLCSLLTFLGILFSQSRGVWIAVLGSLGVALLLYDRKEFIKFILLVPLLLSSFLFFSSDIKGRTVSIFTSVFEEDTKGSTGQRLELWKGSLLIALEAPLLGVGTGNFDNYFERLTLEKKVKEIPLRMHAHNIFLQALATRGTLGFLITCSLFISLMAWGLKLSRTPAEAGGFFVILSTVYIFLGGLTENNIEFTKILSLYCFTIGLLGHVEIEHAESVSIR